MMEHPLIDLVNISKTFDDTMVLDDLNLAVKENTFVTLLGPSGCGKTTTLRIIGGFEKPDTGKVIFDGQDITNRDTKHMVQAGIIRMRPIAMTTLTTVISMVPNAVAYGEAGAMMQGLALVNVGGLTASTILTLLLLPTFYRLVYKMGRKKIGGEGDLVIAD